MKNKEWLATLSDEEFYQKFKEIEYAGRADINTRLFVIEWLGKEHDETLTEKDANEILDRFE